MRPAAVAAWGVAVLWTAVLWAAVVPVPARGRLDVVTPFTQLVALRPVLAVAGILAGAGWWLVLRRRGTSGVAAHGPALLATLAAVLATAQIAPRALDRADPVAAGAPRLTVLTANTLASGTSPAAIAALVTRTGADVVALPETNVARARAYLRALPRDGTGWTVLTDPRFAATDPGPRPTSMLVRRSLRPVRLAGKAGGRGGHGEVRARVRPGGGPAVVVTAVHPVPPPPASTRVQDWRSDVLALREQCRRGWIVAGDLNATLDHSPLRAVLAAGCTDAAAATGQGLRATWHGGPLGLVAPAIDHVLTSGAWRPARAGVLPLAGSDHEAVWATLTPR